MLIDYAELAFALFLAAVWYTLWLAFSGGSHPVAVLATAAFVIAGTLYERAITR